MHSTDGSETLRNMWKTEMLAGTACAARDGSGSPRWSSVEPDCHFAGSTVSSIQIRGYCATPSPCMFCKAAPALGSSSCCCSAVSVALAWSQQLRHSFTRVPLNSGRPNHAHLFCRLVHCLLLLIVSEERLAKEVHPTDSALCNTDSAQNKGFKCRRDLGHTSSENSLSGGLALRARRKYRAPYSLGSARLPSYLCGALGCPCLFFFANENEIARL